ncbi:uncharacterized protein LOC128743444 [Sabethes cyaneus]|uniref:uncharacterized protein LOC128743444 n=1 Tax=Sabethes cyaneus TaxID=53552 RepID=UPI00237E7E22|nr:uncharacterized protein LOC128743444 [Sabethes cyaneus]
MGVSRLQTFLKNQVPGGYSKVSIETEIRHHPSSTIPPIIVVDLKSLCGSISGADRPGLLYGGRYELVYRQLDKFFGRLTTLGVKLVFVSDGPTRPSRFDCWMKRSDDRYNNFIKIIDAVDSGKLGLDSLVQHFGNDIPANTYPFEEIARKHGTFRLSIASDCDQDVATYATLQRAMAVITNDTDFLIFNATWRIWVASGLDMDEFTTFQFNRTNLIQYLELNRNQMPLLASLAGNDIIDYQELKLFHSRIGDPKQTIKNIANFILSRPNESVKALLSQVFDRTSAELENRFQSSIDSYNINSSTLDSYIDPDKNLQILLSENNEFAYQLWTENPFQLTAFFIDLRSEGNGFDYAELLFPLLERQAGIILWEKPSINEFTLIIKTHHNAPHAKIKRHVKRPEHMAALSFSDLFSKDSVVQENTRTTRLQLFCWVVSDKLDYVRIQSVPESLRVTVATLYYLIEKKILKLFEADLLLHVSHEVCSGSYDLRTLTLPKFLKPRPFRVAFLFTGLYRQMSEAYERLGLTGKDSLNYPRFDGVLFHELYNECTLAEKPYDEIREWRLYAPEMMEKNP